MKSHRLWRLGLVCFLVLVASSCADITIGDDGVKGSGTILTESREVSGFSGIKLEASGDVVVAVGSAESLTIETDDNLLPLLRSEVRNGVLRLSPKETISPTERITYRIEVLTLESIEILGSADVSASNVDSEELLISIVGSGTVTPTGTADSIVVVITGSGDYAGKDLVGRTGTIEIAGSGAALVNVTDTLDVSITGSGDITYLGTPQVTTAISGTGSVSAG